MRKTLVELEQQIASLQTLVTQLQATEPITDLDKEVLKQKCINLYEHILALSELHTQEPAAINTLPAAPPAHVPELTIPLTKTEVSPELILTNDIPHLEEPEPVTNAVPDLFAPILQTETEIQNTEIENLIREEEQKVAEEFVTPLMKEEVKEISLHEKIAGTIPVKPVLAEKLSGTGITSLKAAINVNLKIALVNDLFKENTVEYVKAIDRLNTSENIHEAMRYFSELKHTYNWDSNNNLVKELEVLINKRYD